MYLTTTGVYQHYWQRQHVFRQPFCWLLDWIC